MNNHDECTIFKFANMNIVDKRHIIAYNEVNTHIRAYKVFYIINYSYQDNQHNRDFAIFALNERIKVI